MDFYIVDVFGCEKYSGNQLAVVILKEPLSKEKMQQIANEFHFSETTFVSLNDSQNDDFKVNIFTPKNEVPFAGHPTLGTAFIIRNEILKYNINKVILDLEVGKIPVTFDNNKLLWMKQIDPKFGETYNPNDIASIINISEREIDINYPIQGVSTGIEFIIIPLKKLNSIRSASTNIAKYKEYFLNETPKPLFLFCPETYERANQINCRMFADIFGVPEDPATGSANGCLAAYLIRHKYYNTDKINIRVEQGYEIGRKSILYLNAYMKKGKIDIQVGGTIVKIAEGRLL